MATIVRLTEEQIAQLFDEAESMESALKEIHAELVAAGTPKDTLNRYSRMHDRFTEVLAFLRRQRELGG